MDRWPFRIYSDGGVTLALKNGSFAGIGMTELIDIVTAFERQNTVTIKLRAEVVVANGKKDLQWIAEAWSQTTIEQAPALLAYAKSLCLGKRLVTMEAVLLQLLYALDFRLAERELRPEDPKSS